MCECYQIGGRFIAEDPECPVHGTEAQRDNDERFALIQRLRVDLESSDPTVVWQAGCAALQFLENM